MPLLAYLYVEFPIREGKSLFRIRYRVVQLHFNNSGIRICDRGSNFPHSFGDRMFRKNTIQIGKLVSETKLLKVALSHVAERFNVLESNVKLRMEKPQ